MTRPASPRWSAAGSSAAGPGASRPTRRRPRAGTRAAGPSASRPPAGRPMARRGSPLAIGFGDGEMYVGSDALAIGSWTDRICYLDEGDRAVIARSGVEIYDAEDRSVERPVKPIAQTGALIGKGDFRHYMLK